MRLLISTPNLFGHIIVSEHEAQYDPEFAGIATALCGAEVKGQISRARYVCGKCAAILIADRNSINRTLDILERANAQATRMVETLSSIAFPDDDGDDGEDHGGDGSGEPDEPGDGTTGWTPPTEPEADPAR